MRNRTNSVPAPITMSPTFLQKSCGQEDHQNDEDADHECAFDVHYLTAFQMMIAKRIRNRVPRSIHV